MFGTFANTRTREQKDRYKNAIGVAQIISTVQKGTPPEKKKISELLRYR